MTSIWQDKSVNQTLSAALEMLVSSQVQRKHVSPENSHLCKRKIQKTMARIAVNKRTAPTGLENKDSNYIIFIIQFNMIYCLKYAV